MPEARGGNKATYRKNNNRRGIYQPPGEAATRREKEESRGNESDTGRFPAARAACALCSVRMRVRVCVCGMLCDAWRTAADGCMDGWRGGVRRRRETRDAACALLLIARLKKPINILV